jgi:Tol biopolymer transport system component/DNA-binding winged helix-turn-helix (wHTH) protein
MSVNQRTQTVISFGPFEADLRTEELRKRGVRLRLPRQSFQILKMLLERPGELVTREELRAALWPADTFVDFEHSVNVAIRRLREALGDSAENPKYIETLPKLGYRLSAVLAPLPTKSVDPHRGRTVALVTVPLIAVAVMIAVAIWFAQRPLDSRTPEPLTAIPFTSFPGLQTAPSFSPEGSRIAFSWDKANAGSGAHAYDLYIKAIGSETLIRLTNHPSEWISSTWSPDGTQIAFHRLAGTDTGIYVIPALGGPERKLRTTHIPYYGAAPLSWSPDGKWIAYDDVENDRPGDRMFLLNVNTLESHEFPHNPSCNHEADLTFSHSGRQLALVCVHGSFEYFITDIDGKSKRSLIIVQDYPGGLAWSSDDKFLILVRSLETGPELHKLRVSDGTIRKIPLAAAGSWPSVSRDGLAFSVSVGHVNIWRRDLLHPEAAPLQMYTSTLDQNAAQYSPDGKHVAFDSARSGLWSIWIADTDGSNPVQISHEGAAGYPRWSPDSQKVAFQMKGSNKLWGVYIADISDRVPHKLPCNVRETSEPEWSHDGKWIYFRGYEGLYRCPIKGGDAVLLVAGRNRPNGAGGEPSESTDGKVLYFLSRPRNATMMILPLDRPGATPQPVAAMPNVQHRGQWALESDGIYFVPQSAPRSISFYDFSTHKTRDIFKTDRDVDDGISISPDRRYILYSQLDQFDSNIMLVNNFH